jgi:uncharacterized protein (DUF1778 family)
MARALKTEQLQIRVSKSEKSAIQGAAARAGLDVSSYVLSRLSSPPAQAFAQAVAAAGQGDERFALADLNALLTRLTASELREAVAAGVPLSLGPALANTIAAMVEMACAKRRVAVPAWTRDISPLREPVFGSALQSLRLHLLTHSPAPFRRRNIFIDATLDDQV